MATCLILAVPLVLLFSYTKTHKNPKIDLFIPIGGIALIALVLLEGTFQVVTLNIHAFVQKLNEAFKSLEEGDNNPQQQAVTQLLSFIRNIRL